VELCQAKIRTAQIGTAQRRRNQKRTTKPGITEVSGVHPCMTKSGATQVRLAEVGPGEHGGIELSAAHVGFSEAGALQHCLGQQGELHVGLSETGALKA